MELSKLLQDKPFSEVKNLLENDYPLMIKEDQNLPNLYLVTWKKELEDQYVELVAKDPFLQECHGIILEKDSNRVVCYAFGSRLEFDYDDNEPTLEKYGLEWSNLHLEESVEGTQLRLYHYQGEWRVATVRCLDASRARWNSDKNFQQMFQDAVQALNWDYQDLDTNYCHVLVLQHPENRIVVKYDRPNLIHILSRNLSQEGYPEVEMDIGLPRPARVSMDDLEDFEALLERMDKYDDLSIEGYILKDDTSDRRLKIMSNLYRRIKDLRGNVTRGNFIYQYLTLKKNGWVREYLKHFPEDGKMFRKYENRLQDMIAAIHKQYCDKFVNKSITMKEVFFAFRPLIYEVNGIHLETRDIITRKRMTAELYKRDPAQISFIYNKFYEEK